MENSYKNPDLNKSISNKLDWQLIQNEMKKKLGSEVYESWLKKINFIEEFNNYILISVPTRFIRDWITSRYLDQILQIVKIFKKDLIRIEFKIVENSINLENQKNSESLLKKNENISFLKDSFLQYNRVDHNKRFENFVTGSSNKLAYEASLKVTENLSQYNPLYIYGGVGMGKTHLLNSIGFELKKRKKVMFIPAERFMYQFIKSIKANDMVRFKEYFRNTDILLIDDIQFMNGKEAMQEEFFHTFNALLDKGSQMLLRSARIGGIVGSLVGLGVIATNAQQNGWQVSHTIETGITAGIGYLTVINPALGVSVGVMYFVADVVCQSVYNRSLSQIMVETFGGFNSHSRSSSTLSRPFAVQDNTFVKQLYPYNP